MDLQTFFEVINVTKIKNLVKCLKMSNFIVIKIFQLAGREYLTNLQP